MNLHTRLTGILASRVLILAVVAPAYAHLSLAALPGVVAVRGLYSSEYLGDWAKLPTGDELARADLTKWMFRDVDGGAVRHTWTDRDEVRIGGGIPGHVGPQRRQDEDDLVRGARLPSRLHRGSRRHTDG